MVMTINKPFDRFKLWIRFLCWHFWRRGAWIRGHRCFKCFLKHEMWIMYNAELDNQILFVYGDGMVARETLEFPPWEDKDEPPEEKGG